MRRSKNPKLVLLLLCLAGAAFAVGQAAVPTLIFPPGARATGLGEAFVALSDDATATFYNPAGLSLSPLANNWRTFGKEAGAGNWVAVAAKRQLSFGERPLVWAATDKQLLRYDGRVWLPYESQLLEQNDDVSKVVHRFIDDEDLAGAVLDSVRSFNGIGGELKEEDLIEVKLPFILGVNGHITTLALDPSDRLWVGTTAGLRRYDGVTWKYYTSLDGLAGNTVTGISATADIIWVGTDKGLSAYESSEWKTFSSKSGHLPADRITAVYASGRSAWVGTDSGLVRIESDSATTYTTAEGLLSNSITDVALDKENVLWVGHPGGVTSFDGKKWKKFNFRDNRVLCVKTDGKDLVWVGTEKGILRYDRGKPSLNAAGERVYSKAEWKHLHNRNALVGNKVLALATQDRDAWVLTDEAMNHYDRAENQATFSHEQLLPVFNMPDLYHDFLGITWPTEEWGTFGAFVNFISFGTIDNYDPLGRKVGEFYSWELVGSASYGTKIRDDLGIGVNAKFVYSPLAPGYGGSNEKGTGIGKTFAVDAALLKRNLVPRLDFGFHLQNMGPPIFYIDKSQSDPIPLNVKTGFAYRLAQTPLHKMTLLLDINRELAQSDENLQPVPWYKAVFTSLNDEPWRRELEQIVLNGGAEYTYGQFLSCRGGMLYDPDGSRRELTFGLGVHYGNLQIDWSYIFQVPGMEESSPARVGQQRFSLLLKF